MTDQIDAFPETLPLEVEITDPGHILDLGEYLGLVNAVEELKDLPQRNLPGFALALATVQVRMAERQARLIGRNLRHLAKSGIDIAAYRAVSSRGSTLILEPFGPDEDG